MKTWTIDEMLAERPCKEYTQERITELWAGRERLSLRDILMLDIPSSDRIWVACRPGALTDQQQAAWLERIVTRAIIHHALNCGIPTVEAWAQNWLDGTDRSNAAAAAAWTVEAAWAARATTWTAWAAAAARAAERERQVQDCREILTQETQNETQ